MVASDYNTQYRTRIGESDLKSSKNEYGNSKEHMEIVLGRSATSEERWQLDEMDEGSQEQLHEI